MASTPDLEGSRKDRSHSKDFAAHPTGREIIGGMLTQGSTLGYFRFLPAGGSASRLQAVDLDERRRESGSRRQLKLTAPLTFLTAGFVIEGWSL